MCSGRSPVLGTGMKEGRGYSQEKSGSQTTGGPLCARGEPRVGYPPSLGRGQDNSLEEVTMF